MITIHHLSSSTIESALALSTTAGWNQRIEDWRALVALAPGGSFAAESGGRIVATAIGIDYGSFGWIAMMLVEPAFRGRGLGRRLLEAAMGALPGGRPIRLDATPMGRPLYDAYGFREEACLTRYRAAAAAAAEASRTAPAARPIEIRRITADDLPEILQIDRSVFRGARAPVLTWALEQEPAFCQAAFEDGTLAGYCFGRRGRLCDQIGPVVAISASVAQALTTRVIQAAAGRPLFVDAFDAEAGFGEWLGRAGFEGQRPLYRMCRPAEDGQLLQPAASPLRELAIFGPEFA